MGKKQILVPAQGLLECKKKNVGNHTLIFSRNISNTRKSVSSGYPNPEKWVEWVRVFDMASQTIHYS